MNQREKGTKHFGKRTSSFLFPPPSFLFPLSSSLIPTVSQFSFSILCSVLIFVCIVYSFISGSFFLFDFFLSLIVYLRFPFMEFLSFLLFLCLHLSATDLLYFSLSFQIFFIIFRLFISSFLFSSNFCLFHWRLV